MPQHFQPPGGMRALCTARICQSPLPFLRMPPTVTRRCLARDAAAEVRQEFSYQARRLISYSFVLLEVVHCFACLNW